MIDAAAEATSAKCLKACEGMISQTESRLRHEKAIQHQIPERRPFRRRMQRRARPRAGQRPRARAGRPLCPWRGVLQSAELGMTPSTTSLRAQLFGPHTSCVHQRVQNFDVFLNFSNSRGRGFTAIQSPGLTVTPVDSAVCHSGRLVQKHARYAIR